MVRAVDGVSVHARARHGRSASSASPGPARRCCPARSWGCSPASAVDPRRVGALRGPGADRPLDVKQMRHIWGQEMAMIFQDPMTLAEPADEDRQADRRAAAGAPRACPRRRRRETAERLLRDVQIPEAARRLDQYPHELSGGMRQRVMIAIALACGPTLLFADEPTTALDVTVQSQILDLIDEQRQERNMSVILVTHDLGVVAGHTDEIAVMYGGRLVEKAPTQDAVRQHEDAVHRGADGEHPQARGAVALPAARRSPGARRISSTRRSAASSPRAARTPATAATPRSHR